MMPKAVASAVMTALKAAIILMVVGWVLNIPGQLNIPLFTEQMLAAVLGCALALTFLMFPLSRGEVGEEAVAKAALEGRRAQPDIGWIDWILAAAAFTSCLYVAVRYPELIKELVLR